MCGAEDLKKYARERPIKKIDLELLTPENIEFQLLKDAVDYSDFTISIEMQERIFNLTWVNDFKISCSQDYKRFYDFLIKCNTTYHPNNDFYICLVANNIYSVVFGIFKKSKQNQFKKTVFTCHLCYFFDDTICRRYPPQLLVILENGSSKIISKFAKVKSNTPVCGEFDMKTMDQTQ